jgi:predicted N-formylglutamate amidohydrolase
VTQESRLERRSRITVRGSASSAEADRHEFWMQMSDAERVMQAWRLSEEIWRLRGGPPHEPGLHRSVVRIIRNKRATGRPKDWATSKGME